MSKWREAVRCPFPFHQQIDANWICFYTNKLTTPSQRIEWCPYVPNTLHRCPHCVIFFHAMLLPLQQNVVDNIYYSVNRPSHYLDSSSCEPSKRTKKWPRKARHPWSTFSACLGVIMFPYVSKLFPVSIWDLITNIPTMTEDLRAVWLSDRNLRQSLTDCPLVSLDPRNCSISVL